MEVVMKVKKIGHYNLRGPRALMEAVKSFYCEVLGFNVGFRPDFGVDGEWLYIGDAPLLHLSVDEKTEMDSTHTGSLHHIALDCEGLVACKSMLKEKEIPYHVGLVPELGMTQLFIVDPAGLRIELNFVEEDDA